LKFFCASTSLMCTYDPLQATCMESKNPRSHGDFSTAEDAVNLCAGEDAQLGVKVHVYNEFATKKHCVFDL